MSLPTWCTTAHFCARESRGSTLLGVGNAPSAPGAALVAGPRGGASAHLLLVAPRSAAPVRVLAVSAVTLRRLGAFRQGKPRGVLAEEPPLFERTGCLAALTSRDDRDRTPTFIAGLAGHFPGLCARGGSQPSSGAQDCETGRSLSPPNMHDKPQPTAERPGSESCRTLGSAGRDLRPEDQEMESRCVR
jgi:hypothetical protein